MEGNGEMETRYTNMSERKLLKWKRLNQQDHVMLQLTWENQTQNYSFKKIYIRKLIKILRGIADTAY